MLFAIHLASRDGYENSILPNGRPTGTLEQALDCARGLNLNDPTAWTSTRIRGFVDRVNAGRSP